jgi:hypothetical protein
VAIVIVTGVTRVVVVGGMQIFKHGLAGIIFIRKEMFLALKEFRE